MYLASSLAKHLKENKTVTVRGLELIKCPAKSHCKPGVCAKGREESCKKRVEILYEYKGVKSLAHLVFRYQIKGRNGEGYIKCGDRTLDNLIKRGVVDKDALVCA